MVIALGINDFSTSPNPSQAQYCGGYSNFVKTLRGHYPNADIICTYLSSMAGIASSYIQSVVTASGDSKVHFASVSYILVNPTDLGSAGHPNLSGQTKIANAFIPAFDGIMGTNWGSAPHGTPLTWLKSYGFTNSFALAEEGDPDGDGMKTWEEYRAGTDPTNAASVFRLQEIAPVANGIRLTWSGTTNSGVTTPFLLYCATNLFSPAWELRSGSIPRAGNGLNVWTDSVPASGTQVLQGDCPRSIACCPNRHRIHSLILFAKSAGRSLRSLGCASTNRMMSSKSFWRLLARRFGSCQARIFPRNVSGKLATRMSMPWMSAGTERAGNSR